MSASEPEDEANEEAERQGAGDEPAGLRQGPRYEKHGDNHKQPDGMCREQANAGKAEGRSLNWVRVGVPYWPRGRAYKFNRLVSIDIHEYTRVSSTVR